MKQKFELGQKVWYKTTDDNFFDCWKPKQDTIVNVKLKDNEIYYTTLTYPRLDLEESRIFSTENECIKSCIETMLNNINTIIQHINKLKK